MKLFGIELNDSSAKSKHAKRCEQQKTLDTEIDLKATETKNKFEASLKELEILLQRNKITES